MKPSRNEQRSATTAGSTTGRLADQIGDASRRHELSDPDRDRAPVDRFINKFAEVLGVTLISSIVGVIFVNAALRYTISYSIIWAEEYVIGVTPWLAVTGLFLAIRRGSMIRIDYFFHKLPARVRGPLTVVSEIWCAVVLAYLAWASFRYVSFFGADLTPAMNIPKGIFSSALVVGGAVGAFAFMAEAIRSSTRKRG